MPAAVNESEAQAQPPQTVREFERALRGLGFTRPQAMNIARRGFGAVTANAALEPEPEPEHIEQLRNAMERLAQSLKGN